MNKQIAIEVLEETMYHLYYANPDEQAEIQQSAGCCAAILNAATEGFELDYCRGQDIKSIFRNLFYLDVDHSHVLWWPKEDWSSRIIALQLAIEVLKDEQDTDNSRHSVL